MSSDKGHPKVTPAQSSVAAESPILPSGRDKSGTSHDQFVVQNCIADQNRIARDRVAFVALVEIAEGKYRRMAYLTLAGALRAVERAEARGVAASVGLYELVPVVGGLS